MWLQIYVRIRNEEWNTYRRYAEFYDFHCKLRKRNPIFSTFDFPPKKAFGKKVGISDMYKLYHKTLLFDLPGSS